MNLNTYLLAAFFCLILCAAARADGQDVVVSGSDSGKQAATEGSSSGSATDQSSKNFEKTGRFLPGEEVVTTTGKTVKVWSTEGPVPVSRPPEPFEDREKAVLEDSNLLIDGRVPIGDYKEHRNTPDRPQGNH